MRDILQAAAKKLLGFAGVYPTRLTPPAKVRELIHALAPRQSPFPLLRLGPPADGGYLVPDDLAGLIAVFSPGVSRMSGFELDFAARDLPVFLADRSVAAPKTSHPLFSFTRRHVGAFDDEHTMTLDSWVAATIGEEKGDLLLQMDIEGSEYETLLATSASTLQRFRIVVVELHNLEKLWSEPFFTLAGRALEKLLQTHACVHLHPNNFCGVERRAGLEIPRVMEATFLRRDRNVGTALVEKLPHSLDRDNDPRRPSVPLPACWLGR